MSNFGKTQGHQIVVDPATSNLGLGSRPTLNEITLSLDSRLVKPMRILADGESTIVTIASSGPFTLNDGRKVSFPPVNNTHISHTEETFDVATGIFAGGSSQAATPPVATPDAFYTVALMVNSLGNLTALYSSAQITAELALANAPVMLEGQTALGLVQISVNPVGIFNPVQLSDIIEYPAGSGGSSGSGGAAVQPAEGFQVIMPENFSTSVTTDPKYKMRPETTGQLDIANKLVSLRCDKTKTATTTGLSYTLSAAPSFTVQVGDIIWSNTANVFRKVETKLSATTGTLDAAFPLDLAASAVMVSQAVWTKDIVNVGDATEQTRPRDMFPSTDVLEVALAYKDSLGVADNVADELSAARIVASGSNSGLSSETAMPTTSTFTNIFTRPIAPASIPNYQLASNPTKQRLFLVFFCNPNNATVTTLANLLSYEVSFYSEDTHPANGGYLESCYAMSDGSGTPLNCSAPTVVSNKTQWQIFSFVPGANPGMTAGEIEVLLDGRSLPRYVAGTTLDAYWDVTPGLNNSITFWADLSVLNPPLSMEVRKRQGSIDTSSINTVAIAAMQDVMSKLVPVGTYIHSDLTEVQFQSQAGAGWILADGRSVVGSLYANLTGKTNVPDARGLPLRGKNNSRADGKQNPGGDLALGTYQADATAKNGLALSDPGHVHTYYASNVASGAGAPNQSAVDDNTVTNSYSTSLNSSNITLGAGDAETRMKNLTANIFIRIN